MTMPQHREVTPEGSAEGHGGVPLSRKEENQMKKVAKRMASLYTLGVLLAGVLIGSGAAAALEVGEQAPDFTLPSTTGGKISLSQFRGKTRVLLEFYLADFGPT